MSGRHITTTPGRTRPTAGWADALLPSVRASLGMMDTTLTLAEVKDALARDLIARREEFVRRANGTTGF